MSPKLSGKEYFDFKNIFPACYDDFNANIINDSSFDNHTIKNTCNGITNHLKINQNTRSIFKSDCRYLILYLDYIEKNEFTVDIKAYCKYFNYKLKEILELYKCSFKDTKNVYEKMISIGNNSQHKKVANICITDFEDLDEGNFNVLHKLNELYYTFRSKSNTCISNSDCFKSYIQLSDICDQGKNKSLCELLNKFKKENMKYMKNAESKEESPTVSYHSYVISARTIILTLFIISFTILMIIFFLYKVKYNINYTSYRSFLQQILWMFRRTLNKKNKDNLKIMHSFELTYNNLIDNNYQID
ncbi:variable surface protein [Plasmodium gonderi]|uniref:Variable surface protein n=1 Tax=Plasmodium gonderi TaxID=77519 RepID=A0A1Y1JP67_PLAGO|nr:variable surface protein [Plasmodium gonderi]GAW84271.1 variable surface protein [Plasmodium gonderi]